MGSPPIPPHERTWRHPSEVAAAERATIRHTEPPRSTRTFAIATGTVGLVAVALLVFTVTPRGVEPPVAVATTSPIAPPDTRVHANAVAAVTTTVARSVPRALATPIGDGDLALMTLSAVAMQLGSEIDVQLTSGPVVTAVVDVTTPGVVVVSIASGSEGHPIAEEPPDPDEIVTVLAEPPVTIAFSALSTVDAAEGTPVLDRDGDLIGLCTQRHVTGDDPIALIDVTGDQGIDVTEDPAIDARRVVATTAAP